VALSPAAVAFADKTDKPSKQPSGPLFDPEALERGAKALREINASPHAKQVGGWWRAVAPALGGCGRVHAWVRCSIGLTLILIPILNPTSPIHSFSSSLQKTPPPPPNPQVIALSREQEVTKQQELKTDEAKFTAQAAAAAQEQERVRWEMQSKYAQEEAQRKAQMAQYEDELARK